MPAANDVLTTLKQARDRRMAKAKLIEVIVAREGIANREATTAAVLKMLEFHIAKGRIISARVDGVEYLTVVK